MIQYSQHSVCKISSKKGLFPVNMSLYFNNIEGSVLGFFSFTLYISVNLYSIFLFQLHFVALNICKMCKLFDRKNCTF